MKYLNDVLGLVGCGLIVAAAAFVHVALALFLAGAGLVAVAVMNARRGG